VKKLIFLFAFLLVGVAAAAPSIVSTTQTAATVEGLDCGAKYRFEIRRYTADGSLSSTADYVDAQTKSCPDTQAPSAPAGLAATTATQTSVSVSWSASTDNVGVVGYDAYRGGVKIDSTTATTYTFGGLSCGTSYSLAVEARDAAGNRSNASAITASTAACPPPSCPTSEYSAQYYGNVTLSGTPVLQRCEAAINHDWGSGGPGGTVPTDRFSTRWTRKASFTGGSYQFTATADDGIRIWIDGALVVDAWKDQAPTSYQATTTLTAGDHDVKVEYYENGGGAVAKLSWQLTQVPAPPPPPPPPPTPGGEPGPIAGQGYARTFADEFGSLDRSVWCDREWWEGAPPANSQYVQDGVLHTVSRRSQGYANTTVSSEPCGQANPKSFKQGYFEARMKWTAGNGSTPAFWLFSTRHATNPAFPSINPYCAQNGLPHPECMTAELDVFEGQGHLPRDFSGALHRNTAGFYGAPDVYRQVYATTGVDMTAGFHVYSAKWTQAEVCWYLDESLLGCRPTYDSTNQPMHLLFYQWPDSWARDPDASSPDELHTEVDWVRVWQT
jgi:chitodextrinase